mmetsp:Transcript_1162/g.2684  ORF Transcript_1162/g.2684 Transcript_1162/m.2684 type:complete len:219 (-) Transcript_1162:173-829(-)
MLLIPLSSEWVVSSLTILHSGHTAITHHTSSSEPIEPGKVLCQRWTDETDESGRTPDDGLTFGPVLIRRLVDGLKVFNESANDGNFECCLWFNDIIHTVRQLHESLPPLLLPLASNVRIIILPPHSRNPFIQPNHINLIPRYLHTNLLLDISSSQLNQMICLCSNILVSGIFGKTKLAEESSVGVGETTLFALLFSLGDPGEVFVRVGEGREGGDGTV